MSSAVDRRTLPLYEAVFVGLLGYSLMIATFTPMILRNDNGMLPAGGNGRPRKPASSRRRKA